MPSVKVFEKLNSKFSPLEKMNMGASLQLQMNVLVSVSTGTWQSQFHLSGADSVYVHWKYDCFEAGLLPWPKHCLFI